jgi:ATP-dependent DNA helicase RecQ
VPKKDVSADAKLFLTCIQQTGRRFGARHIINVLRGSRAEKVLQWRHDRLPSYGSGKHNSAEEWRALADSFIECEIVQVDMEHGTLGITPAGFRAMQGEKVSIPVIETVSPEVRPSPVEYDPMLFEALRKLWRSIALEESVPPFVVFSDRALMDMASRFPQSSEQFLKVHGVGERKAEAFGPRFLDVIRAYVESSGTEQERTSIGSDSDRGSRHMQVGKRFAEGRTVAELQARWGGTRSTILQNLKRYMDSGGDCPPQDLDRCASFPNRCKIG